MRRQAVSALRRTWVKPAQQPGPVMGAPAGLHHHLGGGEAAEVGLHLGALEVAPQTRAVMFIHAMQREDVLGGVDGNALILHADGPWLVETIQLWHAMPWGRLPQQRPEGPTGMRAGLVGRPRAKSTRTQAARPPRTVNGRGLWYNFCGKAWRSQPSGAFLAHAGHAKTVCQPGGRRQPGGGAAGADGTVAPRCLCAAARRRASGAQNRDGPASAV